MPLNECKRCNHKWMPRTAVPTSCPKCRSFAWDRTTNEKSGRKQNNQQDFFERIEKTEACWLWQGTINTNGYGSFKFEDKCIAAHRFSYQIHNQEDIEFKIIRHTCDNKLCVNPAHLLSGSTQDNVDDRVNRKRSATGAKHHMTKLSPDNVREIRQTDYTKKGTAADLARKLNVSHTALSYVKNHLAHKDVL